jgi:hypothetical protein
MVEGMERKESVGGALLGGACWAAGCCNTHANHRAASAFRGAAA